MMKILATVYWKNKYPGGAERVVANILNNLDNNKFDLFLVKLETAGKEVEYFKEMISPNIKVHRIHTSHVRYALFELRDRIKKYKPDLIYTNLIHVTVITLIAKWLAHSKAKFIFCTHGPPRNIKEKIEVLFVAMFSDKIITVSKGLKKELIEKFKINPKKIKVIYNPIIDSHQINQKLKETLGRQEMVWKKNKPVIVGGGRFERQKAFDNLIKAVAIIVKKYHKDINLLLIGEGSEKEKLKRLTKKLNISDKVFFIEWQNNLFKFLKMADIFVSSSSWEGLGNMIVEALACGCPIVSTDCPFGPSEILENGKYGILVPVANLEVLTKGILKLLENPDLKKKYSQLGKKRANDFLIKKAVKEYKNIFEEIYKTSFDEKKLIP